MSSTKGSKKDGIAHNARRAAQGQRGKPTVRRHKDRVSAKPALQRKTRAKTVAKTTAKIAAAKITDGKAVSKTTETSASKVVGMVAKPSAARRPRQTQKDVLPPSEPTLEMIPALDAEAPEVDFDMLGMQDAVDMPEMGGVSGDRDAEVDALSDSDNLAGGDAADADGAGGDGEEREVPASSTTSKEEDVQSFLAMYFRDMAELDVLRPEEEFETAREIEGLEIALWKITLGFLPGAAWVAATVEKAMQKPFAPFKPYLALAAQMTPKTRASVVKRFENMVDEMASELRELDIDRLFIEAVMSGVHLGVQAARGAAVGFELPFDPGVRVFRDFAQLAIAKQVAIKRAKNEFVKANLRLVVSIARRFNHGRLPLADLIQEGNIGLMKAVERYDYRRGFRFSTYASWWIRHAISRALADKGRAVRLPVHMIDAYHRIAKSERELQTKLERPATNEEIARAAGIEADKLEKMRTFLNESPISLDRPISDDDGRRLIDVLEDPQDIPAPLDQLAVTETHQEMVKLLGHLKPIEADILRKRFGLLNDRERTLKEIGDEYRLSRERVRQLQEQALGKMRKAMGKIDSGGGW